MESCKSIKLPETKGSKNNKSVVNGKMNVLRKQVRGFVGCFPKNRNELDGETVMAGDRIMDIDIYILIHDIYNIYIYIYINI